MTAAAAVPLRAVGVVGKGERPRSLGATGPPAARAADPRSRKGRDASDVGGYSPTPSMAPRCGARTGLIAIEAAPAMAERGDARSIAAPDGLPRHVASNPGLRWRAAGSRRRLAYLPACAPRRRAQAPQSPRTPSAAHSPQPCPQPRRRDRASRAAAGSRRRTATGERHAAALVTPHASKRPRR